MKTNTPHTFCFPRVRAILTAAFLLPMFFVAAVNSSISQAVEKNPEQASGLKHVRMFDNPNIFVYPEVLSSKDKLLVHGKGSKPIPLKSNTRLIWIDGAPRARFGHLTEFILISEHGTRVVKGSWWPILNGQDLFRDGKNQQVEFPLTLTRQST